MNTTVYLIRHSVRMNRSEIETYKTIQPQYLRDEKIILSSEGEKRANNNPTNSQNQTSKKKSKPLTT